MTLGTTRSSLSDAARGQNGRRTTKSCAAEPATGCERPSWAVMCAGMRPSEVAAVALDDIIGDQA